LASSCSSPLHLRLKFTALIERWFSKLTACLADAENGIERVVARVFK